jgi:hypothetical protein
MARSRELKVNIVGDADKLDRELKRANSGLDKLGKQTRLTSTISSKGYAAMRVGATGAAAALGGLVVAGKKVVEAAIESEKSNARLRAQLKALDISYQENAKRIDTVIQKHSQLAGLDDEDLQDAFTAIVRTTGDVNTALRDMALVTDLVRAKNMDVVKAGELVAKIHNGQFGPLKKLGVQFEATTDNVDKLKESQKEVTAVELAGAQAQDRRANSLRAIEILSDRVAGQAQAYGKTTAGSVDRANVAWENLQETIGAAVAPAVEDAATAVADFVNEMQTGTGQGGRFVDRLEEIWKDLRPIITGFARAGRAVGQFALEHPGLVKLAGAVVAVGVAVKGLRFMSAITGFDLLLKAGRKAASGLRRSLASAGTAGGEAAAANAASSFAGTAGKSGKWRSAGRAVGRGFGRGIVIGALAGVATLVPDLIKKIQNSILGAPERLGESIGRRLSGLLGIGRQAGGLIPGSGRGDIVPAMLEPGEFVMQRKIVERYGPTFFANLNQGWGDATQRFTGGGIVARANKLDGMRIPYLYGGGHGTKDGFNRGGMDCSASVSYALGVSPRVSRQFMGFGRPGPGSPNDTKIYANPRHVFAVFNGRGWGTSRENPGGGPGWLSYNHRSGFTIRHLEDGAQKGRGSTGDPQETAEQGKQRLREREERAGSRAVNRITARFQPGISRATRTAAGLATAIEDASTRYGQLERLFGQTEEDLETPGGKARRLTELGALTEEKRKQLTRQKRRAAALRQAIAKLEALLKQGRRARDKSRGTRRAKITSRLKAYEDRLTDLRAELKALGFEIRDTELDIGDLLKEVREVAATQPEAPEPGPTVSERLGEVIGDIDLQERAGILTPEQAEALRIAARQTALAHQGLTERERWQIMGDLKEAQQQATQAMADNTQALRDLHAEMARQNAINESIVGVSLREAQRALADMISGQLGVRTANRAMLPGTGQLARL